MDILDIIIQLEEFPKTMLQLDGEWTDGGPLKIADVTEKCLHP